MKKKLISLILAGAMALSLAACGGSAGGSSETTTAAGNAAGGSAESSGDTLKIGLYNPLSGANAAYGTELRDAALLALDYINEQGGFNGVKGEMIVYDTQGSVEEAVKVASKLINEDKVTIAIGPMNSSEMFASGASLNDAGVYTLGCGTSPTWMQEDWPYVFRAAVNNGVTPPLIIDMMKELGYTSMAGFYGQDDASLATYESFKKLCEEAGIEVKDSESYDQGDTDYSAQVANIVNSGADCVYISVNGETGPVIVKQLRQYGYDGIIFDKESFMTAQVAIAGADNSSYVAFANPYVTYNTVEEIDFDNMKDFCQRFKDKYGKMPQTDSAYRGWDAMLVLWEASKIAGSNEPDALKDATHKISGLEGLGGPIDFTPGDREAYHDVRKFVLDNGLNVEWTKWVAENYDGFLSATGREK